MTLSFDTTIRIARYESIEAERLVWHPIQVKEYEAFLVARPGLEVMQQALPLPLVSLPLLSALYKIEFDNMIVGRETEGMFWRCCLFLALSLRLGEGLGMVERMTMLRPEAHPDDPSRLMGLRFTLPDGGEGALTPIQFARLRPLLAAQNGIRLESDSANPELVQAERDLAMQNAPALDVGIEHMICSVAALSRTEEAEIYEWPILKLERRAASLKRAMDYMTHSIAQMSGTTWKGGNPCPSPWFDRTKEGDSAALTPVEGFAGGGAVRAISNPGVQTG